MLLFSSAASFSQSIPVTPKLGKVSVEECAMTTYPKDTSAAVVVLWESSESSTDFDINLGIPRTRRFFTERVKVLKDEGKDYADGYVLVSQDSDDYESVARIQVTTYNLENGKVVATKMPKSDIVRSMYSDGVEKHAYAARNVKVGSVVEVHYEFTTARFYPIPDFYFQRDVPVNLCEYSITMPDWITTSKTSHGYEHVDYSSEIVNGVDLGTSLPANPLNMEMYRAVDLPAMKDESMVYCTRQYRTGISYDVTAFTLPGYFKDLSRNWTDVSKAVFESEIIKRINASCKFKDEIDPIKSSDTSFIDKVASIVNLVQSKVQWNKIIDLIPDKAADILKTGSGTSADINALAGSAFKYAGFKVSPVLVRLRCDGMLLRYRPSLHSFGAFILQIDSPAGERCYVDASDKSSYVNVLDDQFLTDSGFAVSESGRFEWVDLTSLVKNMDSYLVSATVSADGSVNGHISTRFNNVSSYDFKNFYKGFEKEEKFAEKIEDMVSAEVSGLSVAEVNEYTRSCSMDFDFTREGGAASYDMILVDPFFFKFHSDSKFKEEERKLPVDFDYRKTISYSARFTIPEGYTVDQMPASVKYVSDIPSSLALRYTFDGNSVMVTYMFKNNAMMVTPENYKEFRQYWADISSVYKQMIVLKKVQ